MGFLLGVALLLFAVSDPAGAQCPESCPGDLDGDRRITIDELVTIVGFALQGCDDVVGPSPTPTTGRAPTPTATETENDTTVNVSAVPCDVLQSELESATAAHEYAESDDGADRTIGSNGIPNHAVGTFPNPGNPNSIRAQSYSFTVPVVPAGGGESLRKDFGVAVSGIVFDPFTAEFWNDDRDWRYEALRYATAPSYFQRNGGDDATFHPSDLGVDCNLAHVQPNGAYHYHGMPEELLPETPALTFIGWAADGHPIFARWGYSDPNDSSSELKIMTASYRLKSGPRGSGAPAGEHDGTFVQDWEYEEGLGDLDECNGRSGFVTVRGEERNTYHYYITDTYPYVPRCYRTAPDASFAPPFPPP